MVEVVRRGVDSPDSGFTAMCVAMCQARHWDVRYQEPALMVGALAAGCPSCPFGSCALGPPSWSERGTVSGRSARAACAGSMGVPSLLAGLISWSHGPGVVVTCGVSPSTCQGWHVAHFAAAAALCIPSVGRHCL
jgi:hypothetical protein